VITRHAKVPVPSSWRSFVRRLAVLLLTTAAAVVTLAVPASAERTCYTLGVPGQDHYEYCTSLPIDPSGILR
jgi:hypothetical protein